MCSAVVKMSMSFMWLICILMVNTYCVVDALYLDNIKLSNEDRTYYSYMNTLQYASTNPRTPAPCGKKERGQAYWCLPDLYFIGVSKGGTSSMAMHLNNHHMISNIRNGGKNEGHFFDTRKEMVMSNLCPDIPSITSRPLIMDFTPNYLSVDNVPKLLRTIYRDGVASKLRFIVALREPVSRTISSWLYKKNSHPNLPGFAASIADGMKEGRCISSCFRKSRSKKGSTDHVDAFRSCDIEKCVERVMSSHVVKSMYFYQMLVWLRYFDKSQFYVYKMENFAANPRQVYEDVITWLQLPLYNLEKNDSSCSDGRKVRVNGNGFLNSTDLLCGLSQRANSNRANRTLIEETQNEIVLSKLRQFFRPHNQLLDELLTKTFGQNFSGY